MLHVTRSFSSGNDEIGSSSQQFFFDYKVVNSGTLDNLLVSGGKILIDLSIKRGVRKLPQSFFLVKVGPPNNQSPAFAGRFDNYVSALTKIFQRRPLLRREVEKIRLKLSQLMS